MASYICKKCGLTYPCGNEHDCPGLAPRVVEGARSAILQPGDVVIRRARNGLVSFTVGGEWHAHAVDDAAWPVDNIAPAALDVMRTHFRECFQSPDDGGIVAMLRKHRQGAEDLSPQERADEDDLFLIAGRST